MRQIAIDPGASGGIAWFDSDGIAQAIPMPDGMTAQIDALREILAGCPNASASIEKVGGYMPGNAGPGAVKFARHCGHLESALYCMGVPVEQVLPRKWQAALGALPTGMDAATKRVRKNAIKEAMARAYPHLRVTLKTADALGILTWEATK